MSNIRSLKFAPSVLSWKKLNKFANINDHKTLDWSDSIEFIRRYYEKTPVAWRDSRAGEALEELENAPSSRQHFVEYLVTLYRCGFLGSVISQDLQATAIRRITHAHRFGERTLRDAKTWAIHHGYITQSWAPIGARTTTAAGDWKTKRIRRYSLTYKVRLLVSIIRNANNKKLHDPTPANSANNPNGELPIGGSLDDPPIGKLLRLCKKDDHKGQAPSSHFPEKEDSANADISTRSAHHANADSRPVKHQPQNGATRRNPTKRVKPFCERARVETARTYSSSRKQLLHDLFIFLKPGCLNSLPNAADLYQIAEMQTDPFYPQFLPTVFDWYDLVLTLYTQRWHERRKTVSKIIVPALMDYAAAWTPPPVDLENPLAQSIMDNWERSLCPEPGIFINPHDLPQYFASWPIVRFYLSTVQAGRIKYNYDVIKKFTFCKIFFSKQRK